MASTIVNTLLSFLSLCLTSVFSAFNTPQTSQILQAPKQPLIFTQRPHFDEMPYSQSPQPGTGMSASLFSLS